MSTERRGKTSAGTYLWACVALALVLPLLQCSRGKLASEKQPSREQIAQVVASQVPAYVSVKDLTLDMIPQRPRVVKVNFKARCIALGDLYVEISDPIVPQVVVKIAQKENQEFALYGSLLAQRLVDKWDFSTITIESGLEQLGKPKESFGVDALMYESAEYSSAVDRAGQEKQIAQKNTNEALQAKIKTVETKRREEQAKRDEIEQGKKEKRAAQIKQAQEVFFAGRLCKGTLINRNLSQPIEVQIISANPDACSVECTNPKDGTSQTFEGRIDFAEGVPRLLLKARSPQALSSNIWYFYQLKGDLTLRQSEFGGLDGEAKMGSSGYYKFSLVLRNCQ